MDLVEGFLYEKGLSSEMEADLNGCKKKAKGDPETFLKCVHLKGYDDVVLKYYEWLKKKGKELRPKESSRDYKNIMSIINSPEYQEIVKNNLKRLSKFPISFKEFVEQD